MSRATGEQYFVTHCGTADSLLGMPGYSVRAASVPVEAHDSLQFALAFPPYELPIDLWKSRPCRAAAPRRLARTHHPGGGVWAVHSVYLEKDTMDRDRSYFSHLLHLAAADPAAVLRSWDAPDWATDHARGEGKSLPGAALPAGTAISDESLAAFLSDGAIDGPAELSQTVCPARLRAEPERRRELAARFLQAFAQARAAESGRARLFVHAEPGLVALLLYAAVRLLPPEWTADLTFSTYEAPQRGIQDFRLASVVGTYHGVPGKGLEPDLVAIRGFGVDTLLPARSSAELRGPVPAGFDELLSLAATGEWDLVREVQARIGADDGALARLASAVPVVRALGRCRRNEPCAEDLLSLRADAQGAEWLGGAEDAIWPHLRAAALVDARVRTAFRDWFAQPNRLDELRRDAARALARGDLPAWDAHWTVLRDAADDGQKKLQIGKLLKSLDEHLARLSHAARACLRTACTDCGVVPASGLLAPLDREELAALLSDGIPAAWQGHVCLSLRDAASESGGLLRPAARQFLLSAPPAVLGAFARAARSRLEREPGLLLDLFRPYTPECRPRMDRLLRSNGLEPGTWFMLVQSLNLYSGDWDGYLLSGDRLSRLLVVLGGEGAGREVWAGYLDELSPALFSPHLAPAGADGRVVHMWERTVYGQLARGAAELTASGARLAAALPPGGPGKLRAAADLIRWVEDPGRAPQPGELNHACQAYRMAPGDLVRAAFLSGGFAQREAAALEPFLALFRAAFPTGSDYRQTSAAVTHWIALSSDCPAESRADFQAYLVLAHAPPMWHRDLVEEPRNPPLLPEAAARIHAPADADVDGDVVFEPGPRRRKKSAGRRPRRGDSGTGLWAVGAVAIIVAVVGSVAVIRGLGGSRPDEVQPDRPPVKIEKVKPKK